MPELQEPWPLIGISAVFICIFLVCFRLLRQSINPPSQNVPEKQEDKLKITRCDKECTKVRLLNNDNFVESKTVSTQRLNRYTGEMKEFIKR